MVSGGGWLATHDHPKSPIGGWPPYSFQNNNFFLKYIYIYIM
jgi:hypothetical protein